MRKIQEKIGKELKKVDDPGVNKVTSSAYLGLK